MYMQKRGREREGKKKTDDVEYVRLEIKRVIKKTGTLDKKLGKKLFFIPPKVSFFTPLITRNVYFQKFIAEI